MKTAIVCLSGAILILVYIIALLVIALRMSIQQNKEHETVILPIEFKQEEDDGNNEPD